MYYYLGVTCKSRSPSQAALLSLAPSPKLRGGGRAQSAAAAAASSAASPASASALGLGGEQWSTEGGRLSSIERSFIRRLCQVMDAPDAAVKPLRDAAAMAAASASLVLNRVRAASTATARTRSVSRSRTPSHGGSLASASFRTEGGGGVAAATASRRLSAVFRTADRISSRDQWLVSPSVANVSVLATPERSQHTTGAPRVAGAPDTVDILRRGAIATSDAVVPLQYSPLPIDEILSILVSQCSAVFIKNDTALDHTSWIFEVSSDAMAAFVQAAVEAERKIAFTSDGSSHAATAMGAAGSMGGGDGGGGRERGRSVSRSNPSTRSTTPQASASGHSTPVVHTPIAAVCSFADNGGVLVMTHARAPPPMRAAAPAVTIQAPYRHSDVTGGRAGVDAGTAAATYIPYMTQSEAFELEVQKNLMRRAMSRSILSTAHMMEASTSPPSTTSPRNADAVHAAGQRGEGKAADATNDADASLWDATADGPIARAARAGAANVRRVASSPPRARAASRPGSPTRVHANAEGVQQSSSAPASPTTTAQQHTAPSAAPAPAVAASGWHSSEGGHGAQYAGAAQAQDVEPVDETARLLAAMELQVERMESRRQARLQNAAVAASTAAEPAPPPGGAFGGDMGSESVQTDVDVTQPMLHALDGSLASNDVSMASHYRDHFGWTRQLLGQTPEPRDGAQSRDVYARGSEPPSRLPFLGSHSFLSEQDATRRTVSPARGRVIMSGAPRMYPPAAFVSRSAPASPRSASVEEQQHARQHLEQSAAHLRPQVTAYLAARRAAGQPTRAEVGVMPMLVLERQTLAQAQRLPPRRDLAQLYAAATGALQAPGADANAAMSPGKQLQRRRSWQGPLRSASTLRGAPASEVHTDDLRSTEGTRAPVEALQAPARNGVADTANHVDSGVAHEEGAPGREVGALAMPASQVTHAAPSAASTEGDKARVRFGHALEGIVTVVEEGCAHTSEEGDVAATAAGAAQQPSSQSITPSGWGSEDDHTTVSEILPDAMKDDEWNALVWGEGRDLTGPVQEAHPEAHDSGRTNITAAAPAPAAATVTSPSDTSIHMAHASTSAPARRSSVIATEEGSAAGSNKPPLGVRAKADLPALHMFMGLHPAADDDALSSIVTRQMLYRGLTEGAAGQHAVEDTDDAGVVLSSFIEVISREDAGEVEELPVASLLWSVFQYYVSFGEPLRTSTLSLAKYRRMLRDMGVIIDKNTPLGPSTDTFVQLDGLDVDRADVMDPRMLTPDRRRMCSMEAFELLFVSYSANMVPDAPSTVFESTYLPQQHVHAQATMHSDTNMAGGTLVETLTVGEATPSFLTSARASTGAPSASRRSLGVAAPVRTASAASRASQQGRSSTPPVRSVLQAHAKDLTVRFPAPPPTYDEDGYLMPQPTLPPGLRSRTLSELARSSSARSSGFTVRYATARAAPRGTIDFAQFIGILRVVAARRFGRHGGMAHFIRFAIVPLIEQLADMAELYPRFKRDDLEAVAEQPQVQRLLALNRAALAKLFTHYSASASSMRSSSVARKRSVSASRQRATAAASPLFVSSTTSAAAGALAAASGTQLQQQQQLPEDSSLGTMLLPQLCTLAQDWGIVGVLCDNGHLQRVFQAVSHDLTRQTAATTPLDTFVDVLRFSDLWLVLIAIAGSVHYTSAQPTMEQKVAAVLERMEFSDGRQRALRTARSGDLSIHFRW